MKPRERHETRVLDMFRSLLDQIIDLKHELVTLSRAVSWSFIETKCGEVYADGSGMPPLPTRLMAGLAILKFTFDLSDEELCARWVENSYFQYLCGEALFLRELPFDRSSLTRWRQRRGEVRVAASLSPRKFSMLISELACDLTAANPANPLPKWRRHPEFGTVYGAHL